MDCEANVSKMMVILGGMGLAFVLAVTPASAESRFFLFVAHEVPSQALIDSAIQQAQLAGPPVGADVSRARLSRVFPHLFDAATGERTTVSGELKAGTTAHYATNFEQAEIHFSRAFEAAFARPDLLDASPMLIRRLADGAALRYANATAATRDVPEARRRFKEFVRRYPSAEPTRTEHPPPVLELWEKLRDEVLASTGPLMVHLQPLELERSGNCRLLVNGAEVGRMPLAGPVEVPTGEQFVQATCGLQRSWLQRLDVRAEPITVRIPLRAMLATRAESRSGGLVLTQPEEGDSSALVEAVSAAAGFDGAVIVQTAVSKVLIGRWERGSASPSVAYSGQLADSDITNVTKYDAADSSGGGRVFTWIVGGLGLAALGGAIGTNVAFNSEFNSDAPDREALDTLQTASTALYITGGALLVTSIVLFFVEGGGDDDASASVRGGPGLIHVTF